MYQGLLRPPFPLRCLRQPFADYAPVGWLREMSVEAVCQCALAILELAPSGNGRDVWVAAIRFRAALPSEAGAV
jgi:hypothetical protein